MDFFLSSLSFSSSSACLAAVQLTKPKDPHGIHSAAVPTLPVNAYLAPSESSGPLDPGSLMRARPPSRQAVDLLLLSGKPRQGWMQRREQVLGEPHGEKAFGVTDTDKVLHSHYYMQALISYRRYNVHGASNHSHHNTNASRVKRGIKKTRELLLSPPRPQRRNHASDARESRGPTNPESMTPARRQASFHSAQSQGPLKAERQTPFFFFLASIGTWVN